MGFLTQGLQLGVSRSAKSSGGWHDPHLHNIYKSLQQMSDNPLPALPPRTILPMRQGDVEAAGAGMAVLNNLDWMQMTESERQPYREEAASIIIQARKDAELKRQAALEAAGAFDGLDGHDAAGEPPALGDERAEDQ